MKLFFDDGGADGPDSAERAGQRTLGSAMPEERLAVVRRARTSTGMSCPPGRSSGDQDRGVPGRPAGPAETVVWARQARWTGAGGRPAQQRG